MTLSGFLAVLLIICLSILENTCSVTRKGQSHVHLCACAPAYMCLALQKCQCVTSIFKIVSQLR